MGDADHQRRRRAIRVVAAAFLLMLVTGCSAGAVGAEHLSSGCREGRRIALTFDDGPNPPYTEQILDILRSHNAAATFFDEGEAATAHPDVVQQELTLGMVVGSHSYAHSQDLPAMSRGDFRRDLRQAEAALTPALGYAPGLYRAPYGHTSDNMLAELRAAGYTSIGWDLDSTDWSDASADQVVREVLDNAHPGAIVLMHDGGLGGGNRDRATTLAALPRIIDGLRERGYTFATVPELTGAPAERGGRRRAACSGS